MAILNYFFYQDWFPRGRFMKNIFTVAAIEVQESQKMFVSHPLTSNIREWLKTSSFQWQSSHWPLHSPNPCCMSVDGAAICHNVHVFLSIVTIFVATEISSVSVSFQLELSCFVGLNSTTTWKQKVIFETEPQESQRFGCLCRSFAQALYTWNVFLRKEELVLIACNMGLWLIKVVLSVMI